MRPWYFGNTTVRSPFRLREGLIALSESKIEGQLRGRDQEQAFRDLLGERQIVALGADESYSVGRKWRVAMNQLGFLFPEVPGADMDQTQLGALDTITENGRRLIQSDNVPAMQECFLRSLAAYKVPSILEPNFPFASFSPLKHTLTLMLELERQSGSSALHFIELATIVQFSSSRDDATTLVAQILDLRRRRDEAVKKRAFDRTEYEAAARTHNYVQTTFRDYADLNIRYLKATGLVQSKGRGITFVPEKHVICERLAATVDVVTSDLDYLINLCRGAALPTDNRNEAAIVLQDLIDQLRRRGIPFTVGQRPQDSAADIAILRYEAQNLILEKNEEEYAERQAGEWREIVAYMEMLTTRRMSRREIAEGIEISIPQTEAPAYFEWILWRAFLAIDSLTIPPYQARRFKIDQDFLPISTAPGNGPDLVLEFAGFVLAVEVTLTDNSRQEAAEGEPVRRHVADLVIRHREATAKPVFGLFLANRIDSNTAETFRHGSWYDSHDNQLRLDIVPFTLVQFLHFFKALFENDVVDANRVRGLLEACSELRETNHAPAWKNAIQTTVDQHVRDTGNERTT